MVGKRRQSRIPHISVQTNISGYSTMTQKKKKGTQKFELWISIYGLALSSWHGALVHAKDHNSQLQWTYYGEKKGDPASWNLNINPSSSNIQSRHKCIQSIPSHTSNLNIETISHTLGIESICWSISYAIQQVDKPFIFNTQKSQQIL